MDIQVDNLHFLGLTSSTAFSASSFHSSSDVDASSEEFAGFDVSIDRVQIDWIIILCGERDRA